MKLIYFAAVAAIGVAAPAVAQPPMSGPSAATTGMHRGSPETGGAGSMAAGHQGNAARGGMHTNDPMGTGDEIVSHHGRSEPGIGQQREGTSHRNGMRRKHCRMVYQNHHRVRRCM